MRIYIHAGMHKTGTTYIQNCLAENRRALAERGLAIWPHAINDEEVVRCVADDPTVRISPDLAAREKRLLLKHIAACRARGFRKYILVGEAIGLRLDPASVARMKAALADVAESVHIVFYVREPISFAASSIQERVKNGSNLWRARRGAGNPRYRLRMEAFLDIFPRERVDVRLFHRPALVEGDSLADFFDAIGEYDVVAALKPTRIANESLTVEATYIWDRLVRLAPEAKTWPLRQHVQDLLSDLPGRPFRLSKREAARIRKESAPDLAWLKSVLGRDIFEGVETPLGTLDWDMPRERKVYFARLTLEAARARLAREATLRRRICDLLRALKRMGARYLAF